jgi:hypothetical protein
MGDRERVSDPVHVVVAEGPSTRKGLLRFVLEGEGYDVVAEASTSAELARTVSLYRPDVVVLDDGIGAMAVAMIREIVPSTRVILVWPGAVVPIGGDARVEPSEVLRELGRTMERLTGQPSTTGGSDTLLGRDAVDRARKDPATLREILARGEAAQLQRPHPSRAGETAAFAGEAIIEDREPAPVVILPVVPSVDEPPVAARPEAADTGDVVVVPEADDAGAATASVVAGSAPAETGTDGGLPAGTDAAVPLESDPEANEFNRKLGTIALSGAAAAGALVLALALGGSRVPVAEVRGEAPIADDGASPVTIAPVNPADPVAPLAGEGATGAWIGDGARPYGGGGLTPTTGGTNGGAGTSGSGGGGTAGGGSGGGGGGGTGGGGTGGGGTGGGDGTGGTGGGGTVDDGLPGRSGAHNPHGGPPGQTGVFPGQGNGGNHQGPGNGHGDRGGAANAIRRHAHKR